MVDRQQSFILGTATATRTVYDSQKSRTVSIIEVVAMLVGILAWLLGRSITRPVKRAPGIAERIGSDVRGDRHRGEEGRRHHRRDRRGQRRAIFGDRSCEPARS